MTLADAIQAMVLNQNGHSVEELAEVLGLAPGTLYNKLNPYDERHKLGVLDLLRLMQVLQDNSPLVYMAGKLGCVVRKLRDTDPDKATLVEELLDNHDSLTEYARVLQSPTATEQDVLKARADLDAELDQDMTLWRHGRRCDG